MRSGLSPPQRLRQWGNGEKTVKEGGNGESKGNGGCAGDDGKFHFSPAPAMESSPSPPAPARLFSPLPIPHLTVNTKETSGLEWDC